MLSIVILIQATVGLVWQASESIKLIDGISQADVVTGPYDIIAYTELESTEDLRELTRTIHGVEGIKRTETCVVI